MASRYITSRQEMESLIAGWEPVLARDARLGIDTEFIRERTYAPLLEVVQLAVRDGEEVDVALVDIPALGNDREALRELLLRPNLLKIVHSGSQDVEILALWMGSPPAPLYDTQVAAAFAGYSLQTGYGALVQSLLAVRLSKDEGFADWSRRPLTPAMRDYAENDVRYLHALHDRLTTLLKKRGRTEWVAEQTTRVLGSAAETIPIDELWRRVSGRNTLERRGLAVLRELAVWRDEEARRRDKPRRSVLKDEVLVDIARRAPQTGAAVLALRSAPPNLGERAADTLALRVQKALESPRETWPEAEIPLALDEQGAALVELLSAVVRMRALEEHLPPSLLANSDDLRALAANRTHPDAFTGELFSGWRGDLIGRELRAVLTGTSAVRWDNAAGKLRLIQQ